VLPSRRARDPESLFELGARIRRLERAGSGLTAAGLAAAALATLLAAAGGA
jgi:hypothetical protein